LKLTIKNPQIAGAINLGGLKEKLAKQKSEPEEVVLDDKKPKTAAKAAAKKVKKEEIESPTEQLADAHDKKKRVAKSAKVKEADEVTPAEKVHAPKAPLEKVSVEKTEKASTHKAAIKDDAESRVASQEAEHTTPRPTFAAVEKKETVSQSTFDEAPQPRAPMEAEKVVADKPQDVAAPRLGPVTQSTPPVRPATPSYAQKPAAPPSQNFGQRKPPYPSSQSQSRPFNKQSSSSSFIPQAFSAREPSKETSRSSAPQPLIRPVLPSKEPPATSRPEGAAPRNNDDLRSREGSYPARREGGYPPRREGGYPPREGGYPPRREGGYPPREGNFAPREGGYPPRREGGYPPREGGYPPRAPGAGYGPRPAGGYPPRAPGSGYPPRTSGGYPPRAPGAGYPPRAPGGAFPPRAVPPGKDQTRGEEFERARKSFEDAEKRFKGKAKDTGKTPRRTEGKDIDARTRHGVVSGGDEDDSAGWRRRRHKGHHHEIEQEISRPSKIKVRLPISIKDLAQEMKLKASEVIGKLFLHGTIKTLNDLLDDATTVELVGHEFHCEITIDTKEEERVRISNKNVREEISLEESSTLVTRAPVVAFMGHVDHGKTSLIDAIRKSNRAQKEVGAITQHIGAFRCKTSHGDITILDTPGHEAFTLMRERGAGLTDIVVLVVAGDEGMQEQTIEAIRQAKEAKSTIVVAMTKCDKPNFDRELVYRQLADQELLPEAWGGTTVTVACSAVSHEGVQELVEMLALQSEVLELKANPNRRARGMVIESEMQQGLGAVATVLIQNGTLKVGDSIVFSSEWARVKGMRNEHGAMLKEAGPSTPVQITGLSGLPEAGDEFIAVKDEKEAKEIAETRKESKRQLRMNQAKKIGLEGLIAGSNGVQKKICTLILRADVQGSLEALATALKKIRSDKVDLNIISENVGQISESDAELAIASKAIILGFHTGVEAHAEPLLKEKGVKVVLHNIIYHAVDDIRAQMKDMLDKLPEEKELGKAEVKMTFKASQLGVIAGCQVIEGTITRSAHVRVRRGKDVVWKGSIQSLKRSKDDVREVAKGIECGILLAGYSEAQAGDIIEAYEIIYITQEL